MSELLLQIQQQTRMVNGLIRAQNRLVQQMAHTVVMAQTGRDAHILSELTDTHNTYLQELRQLLKTASEIEDRMAEVLKKLKAEERTLQNRERKQERARNRKGRRYRTMDL